MTTQTPPRQSRTDAYAQTMERLDGLRQQAHDLGVVARAYELIADDVAQRRPDSPLINDVAQDVVDYARQRASAARELQTRKRNEAELLEGGALRDHHDAPAPRVRADLTPEVRAAQLRPLRALPDVAPHLDPSTWDAPQGPTS